MTIFLGQEVLLLGVREVIFSNSVTILILYSLIIFQSNESLQCLLGTTTFSESYPTLESRAVIKCSLIDMLISVLGRVLFFPNIEQLTVTVTLRVVLFKVY